MQASGNERRQWIISEVDRVVKSCIRKRMSAQAKNQLISDLFYLVCGYRSCILLDYIVLDTSDLNTLMKGMHDLEPLIVLNVSFFILFEGKEQMDMNFVYMANRRLLLHISQREAEIFHKRLYINIDILETKLPILLTSDCSERYQQGIQHVSHLVFSNVVKALTLHPTDRIVQLDLSESLKRVTSIIPFDATLMNGFLLNYPIILYYGSRIVDKDKSCERDFQANHCLNNTEIHRYSLLENGDHTVMQFTIPCTIITEYETQCSSIVSQWLQDANDMAQSNMLVLKHETVQCDNIVL